VAASPTSRETMNTSSDIATSLPRSGYAIPSALLRWLLSEFSLRIEDGQRGGISNGGGPACFEGQQDVYRHYAFGAGPSSIFNVHALKFNIRSLTRLVRPTLSFHVFQRSFPLTGQVSGMAKRDEAGGVSRASLR
jgi:hypothetical protein